MADETPPSFFAKPPQRPAPPPTPPGAQPPTPPGAQPPTPPGAQPPVPGGAPKPVETTVPHPWTRYFARSLDILVGGFAVGVVLGLVAPGALAIPNFALGFLVVFVWVFIETALLASWGTTPGKWLLGTTVRTTVGSKLDGWAALRRSFDVWLRGLGVGIPLISLFTMLKAYNLLQKEGKTLWDANGDLVVSHAPLRAVRIVIAILVVLAWAGLVALGSSSPSR